MQPMLVLTATSSRAEAQSIADAAVEQRLAAAAQVIGPVISAYRWKSRMEHTEEWLCLLKTSAELYTRSSDSYSRSTPMSYQVSWRYQSSEGASATLTGTRSSCGGRRRANGLGLSRANRSGKPMGRFQPSKSVRSCRRTAALAPMRCWTATFGTAARVAS
jgi:uncharacterized protein involved in tolerance to divalent cations